MKRNSNLWVLRRNDYSFSSKARKNLPFSHLNLTFIYLFIFCVNIRYEPIADRTDICVLNFAPNFLENK